MSNALNEKSAIPTELTIPALLEGLKQRRRTPVSTYRLQMHRHFGFRDAAAILPYLARLGITDSYTSSLLKARPGSTHGYDITDHNALNPELGSPEDYEQFVRALRQSELKHLLDFVPNHMGIDPKSNPWWRDVLENGPSSPYAHYFDIDWSPIKTELKNKVLLPILGDQYGVVLERGELHLIFVEGALALTYGEQNLPINPREIPVVFKDGLEDLQRKMPDSSEIREFRSIMTELSNLPPITERSPERIEERQREKEVARERLNKLAKRSSRIHDYIMDCLKTVNGEPGQTASFDTLHHLLESQAYRLAYWKTASHEINYRRFFDINELAGLHMEYPDVFAATHKLVLRLIAEGKIDGLRVDHIDGLYDPAAYSESVQDAFLQEWVKRQWSLMAPKDKDLPSHWLETVRAWRVAERKKNPTGLAARPLYVTAEKILSSGETLDPHWAIDGTSGYDFLNDLNGLFVDSANEERFKNLYARFALAQAPYAWMPYICKRLIMSTSMASELTVLANALNQISEADRRSRDFTYYSLRDALREVIACFPVYRTYINASRCSAWDRQTVEDAVLSARHHNPAMESSIFDFIHDVLIPTNVEKVPLKEFRRQLQFAMTFQQYTGPVEAKGLEDTAFYRYNMLLSLNEVGGDPSRFGRTPAMFHEANLHRHKEWPYAMLATATHDTKRGEDVRARINVLSEIPVEWEEYITRWAEINAGCRTLLKQVWVPDRNEEYFYYQSLIGAWPAQEGSETREVFVKRISAYMIKALKEARIHSSWINANEDYEKSVAQFVEKTLTGENSSRFLASFIPFAERIAREGVINSLSQVILKTASPGVPDFYQGTELWDLNVVDPDNRRPVDFTQRDHLLTGLDPSKSQIPIQEIMHHWQDGRIKLLVTTLVLRFRKKHPDLFLKGSYTPLHIEGDMASHALAFARDYGPQKAIIIVPRLMSGKKNEPGLWSSTWVQLPGTWGQETYKNLFTPESIISSKLASSPRLLLSEVFASFPIAWLYI